MRNKEQIEEIIRKTNKDIIEDNGNGPVAYWDTDWDRIREILSTEEWDWQDRCFGVKFVNLTPHVLNLNDGTSLESEGVARVDATFTEFEDGMCRQSFGELTGLPGPIPGVFYVVSAVVLAAAKLTGREDVVAPATGHPQCVRQSGQIVSVPGFVR